MKYQELLHLHALLAKIREYCETDLNMEVEPTHFEAYEEQGTQAFHLNAQKPDHREAVITLGDSLITLIEANSDVPLDALDSAPTPEKDDRNEHPADQSEPSTSDADISGNGRASREKSVTVATPSESVETDIRGQFTAETNPEATEGGLWDYTDGTEFDPPEYVEAAPTKKQALTVSGGDDTVESEDDSDDTEQSSISNSFS